MYILNGVQKAYGKIHALRGISATIRTDGFVCVLGPSGSGKSTLLRLLSFTDPPDCGNLALDLNGTHFESSALGQPWPRLTAVFQKHFLWPHLTLRENISLPLFRLEPQERANRIMDVIDLFSMSSFVDRFPNEVSGGQAQRAALARAFVLKSELILIDEVHGELDVEQQEIINAHLLELHKAGVGLIVVTHSLDFARKYADEIIVIEGGAITESGTVSILEHPSCAFLHRVLELGAKTSNEIHHTTETNS